MSANVVLTVEVPADLYERFTAIAAAANVPAVELLCHLMHGLTLAEQLGILGPPAAQNAPTTETRQ